jgi:predicted aldo/keto reductase-like oxidoreductase
MKTKRQDRRQFIKTSSAGMLGASLSGSGFIGVDRNNPGDDKKIKNYKMLGRTGFRVSEIGFGKPANPGLIRAALDAGVNYFDTAPNYGSSQADIGKIIHEYDRKSIFITSKINSRNLGTKEQILDIARKNLETLKVDYIDCFLLQRAESREMVKHKGLHDAFDQLKAEGRAKYLGIACHGTLSPLDPAETMQNILLKAIEDGRFDLILVVYNFLQCDEGAVILEAARNKNIATTVMKTNPVSKYYVHKASVNEIEADSLEMPGSLRRTISIYEKYMEEVDAYVKQNGIVIHDEQFRDIATRFVLQNPDIDCALVNFKNYNDLDFHLQCSGAGMPHSDQTILELFKMAMDKVYCRIGCGECEAFCPQGVPVNTIMRYNYYFRVKGEEKHAMMLYNDLPGSRPDVCTGCPGYCERACPYGIATRSLLAMAHRNLSFNGIHTSHDSLPDQLS